MGVMDDAKNNATTDTPRMIEPGSYTCMPYVLMRRVDLSASAKLVWMALMSHLGQGAYEVWPSMARLAWMTGLGRATVIRAIEALEAEGLIVVIREEGEVSRYRVRQPEAEDLGGTGIKMIPVSKRDGTRLKMRRDRYQNETRTTQRTTPGTNTPLTPRDAGGGCGDASPVAAEEVAGRDEKPSPQNPAEEAGQAMGETVEAVLARIEAAYREVFGHEATLDSKARRKIRRGWKQGDAWWLARIDADAIRAGQRKAAEVAGRAFGLGWVAKAIAEQAAAEQAKANAQTARERAAEEAARQAERRAAEQAEARQRTERELACFRRLEAAARERWIRRARQANPYLRREDLIEQQAARLACTPVKEAEA
jgi:biotin operon repressor